MNTRKSYCVPESVVHGGSAAMTVNSVAFANFHDINIRVMTYSKLECHVIECSVRKRHTQQPSWASASQCQHTAASGWHLLGTETRRGEIRNRGFFFHPWGAVCPSHFYFSLYLSLERFLLLTYTAFSPISRLQIFRPPKFSRLNDSVSQYMVSESDHPSFLPESGHMSYSLISYRALRSSWHLTSIYYLSFPLNVRSINTGTLNAWYLEQCLSLDKYMLNWWINEWMNSQTTDEITGCPGPGQLSIPGLFNCGKKRPCGSQGRLPLISLVQSSLRLH